MECDVCDLTLNETLYKRQLQSDKRLFFYEWFGPKFLSKCPNNIDYASVSLEGNFFSSGEVASLELLLNTLKKNPSFLVLKLYLNFTNFAW